MIGVFDPKEGMDKRPVVDIRVIFEGGNLGEYCLFHIIEDKENTLEEIIELLVGKLIQLPGVLLRYPEGDPRGKMQFVTMKILSGKYKGYSTEITYKPLKW